VVARKNHRADRSQGRLWRLGWLTGRDDDGVLDLVGEGLALGAVPDWEQPAEVAGRAVEQVREQAEERSSRPEGPARPLVDQPGPGDLFAPALPGEPCLKALFQNPAAVSASRCNCASWITVETRAEPTRL
jgi:hypothetical protein